MLLRQLTPETCPCGSVEFKTQDAARLAHLPLFTEEDRAFLQKIHISA